MSPAQGRPSDYASLVRANASRTKGFVLADSGECLDIRDAEIARIQRSLRPITSKELEVLELPPSWLLGVILCPGDDMARVAAWTSQLPASDRERVRLYPHERCDLIAMLAPWYAGGLDDPRADEVRDFATFHRFFGNDLNDQIYADATRGRA